MISKQKQLVLHVGTGKTGTSSIQKASAVQKNYLKNKGWVYLGLNGEHYEDKLYIWQEKAASSEFQKLSKIDFDEQFLNLLKSSIYRHNRIFIVNELFFGYSSRLKNVLQEISKICDVKIFVYLRHPVSYSISAFKQWGISHKTYDGFRQLSFSEFLAKNGVNYSGHLESFSKINGCELSVFNYEEIDNVTNHFFEQLGVVIPPNGVLNKARSGDDLMTRALFNTMVKTKVLPSEFNESVVEMDECRLLWDSVKKKIDIRSFSNDLIFSELDSEIRKVNEILLDNDQIKFKYSKEVSFDAKQEFSEPTDWEKFLIINFIKLASRKKL